MVALPPDKPLTSPVLFTVATAILEEVHALVTAGVPLPTKVVFKPTHTDAEAGSNVGKAFTVTAAVAVQPELFV